MAGKHTAPVDGATAASGAGAAPDGRQTRWQQHNSDRRQRIIDAALKVIGEQQPGAELHVQQIAAEAGLSRTVIYRHFEDRADLDHAIQGAILAGLWERMRPELTLEGTVPAIIERIVGSYVDWAVEHPALHRAADWDNTPDGPLERSLEEIAAQVSAVIGTALLGLGAQPTDPQAAALDPLVYGIVGAVFGAVRRWVARPDPALTGEMLKQLTSQSVWFVLDGHARELGVQIDPRRDIGELLTAVG